MTAPVPSLDPRPLRTMVDMGMGHTSRVNMGGQMPDMSMEDRGAEESGRHGRHTPGTGIDTETPTPSGSHTSAPVSRSEADAQPLLRSRPTELHLSPEVDNIAETPTERLSTAGEGFPPGRRVLAYPDLRARYRGTDPRPPSREIELHLTGNMERFIWTFDGEKFSDAEPIRLTLGERVRIILVNDSMMEHPIHLHGLWSELENGQGEFRPYKHTINVKPGERLSFLVSADTPGHWAFHCHLLYHMEAGMFRTVIVS